MMNLFLLKDGKIQFPLELLVRELEKMIKYFQYIYVHNLKT